MENMVQNLREMMKDLHGVSSAAGNARAALERIRNTSIRVNIDKGQVDSVMKSIDKSMKSITNSISANLDSISASLNKTGDKAESEASKLRDEISKYAKESTTFFDGLGKGAEGVFKLIGKKGRETAEQTSESAGNAATSTIDKLKNGFSGFTGMLGGIGGAVQGAIGIISLIGDAAKTMAEEANRPMNELKERIEETQKAHEEAKKAAQDNYKSQMVDIDILKIGIGNLDDMIKNNADGRKIDLAVQTLVNQFPELEGAVDKVNGKWEIQKDRVDAVIESMEQQALAELAYDDLKSALDTERTARKEVDAIEAEKKAVIEADPQEYQDYLKAQSDADQKIAAYNDLANKVNDQAYMNTLSDKDQVTLKTQYRTASTEMNNALETLASAKFDKFKELDNRLAVAEEAWSKTNQEKIQAEKNYQEEVYGTTNTQGESTDVYAPEWSEGIMSILNPLKDSMGNYNAAYNSVSNGQIDWGLRQAGATEEQIKEFGGSTEEAMQFINDKIKEEAETYLTQSATKAEEYLTTYGDQLSDTEKVQLQNYIDTVKSGLAGSAEDMGRAIEWLRTWKLPIDATVTIQTIGNGTVTTKNTNYGDGTETRGSTSQPGHEATGTSFYPGGVTTINEQGDEMIELPTGSKIYPARESGRMYQQMQGGMYNIFNVSEVVIREEADVDRILSQIVTKLDRARRNMA